LVLAAVKREIKILQNLAGGTNIIRLLDIVRSTSSPCLRTFRIRQSTPFFAAHFPRAPF
jgi:hypothetical protein